jgi:hypothetical protein
VDYLGGSAVGLEISEFEKNLVTFFSNFFSNFFSIFFWAIHILSGLSSSTTAKRGH